MADARPETTTPTTAKPSLRAGVVAATAVSGLTLLIAIFELSMADWPSGLVLMVVLPLVALSFFACCLWSATQLLRIKNDGVRFAIPFSICAATLALLVYAPLQQIYLHHDFYRHRAEREQIVAQVERGELKPNVEHNENLIALGKGGMHVSAGNDIIVERTDEGSYVLFLTSRGLKHYFTGFLRVPPGGDPKDFFEFDEQAPTQLVRYDKDWYFVAN